MGLFGKRSRREERRKGRRERRRQKKADKRAFRLARRKMRLDSRNEKEQIIQEANMVAYENGVSPAKRGGFDGMVDTFGNVAMHGQDALSKAASAYLGGSMQGGDEIPSFGGLPSDYGSPEGSPVGLLKSPLLLIVGLLLAVFLIKK